MFIPLHFQSLNIVQLAILAARYLMKTFSAPTCWLGELLSFQWILRKNLLLNTCVIVAANHFEPVFFNAIIVTVFYSNRICLNENSQSTTTT